MHFPLRYDLLRYDKIRRKVKDSKISYFLDNRRDRERFFTYRSKNSSADSIYPIPQSAEKEKEKKKKKEMHFRVLSTKSIE